MLQTHQQYYRPKNTHPQQKLVKSNSYHNPNRLTRPIDHHHKRSNCKRVSLVKDDDDIPLALLAYKKGYQLSMASSSSTAVDQRIQSLLSTESSSCSHTSLIKPAPLVTRPKHTTALEGKKKKNKKPRPRNHPPIVTVTPVVEEPPPSKKKKKLSFSILKNKNWLSSIRKLLVR
jgi:hypothetical protein